MGVISLARLPKLSNAPLETGPQKVRAVVRVRSDSGDEKAAVAIQSSNSVVCVNPRNRDESLVFAVDSCYGQRSTQLSIFDGEVAPLLRSVMQGVNSCVFAYGNTGAGKTFTMLGTEKQPGIVPRTIEHLFALVRAESFASVSYSLQMCYFEIYQDRIYDLLSSNSGAKECSVDIREAGNGQIHVTGLITPSLTTIAEFHKTFAVAAKRRTTAATALNSTSSRSHAVLQFFVNAKFKDGGVKSSKLSLVDLAGSEDNRSTGNTGIRMVESGSINSSLHCLGRVVDALNSTVPGTRIPYRESKLTRILQDCLGGKSRAVLIANVVDSDAFLPHTANTLSFASKSRKITNNVQIAAVSKQEPEQPVGKRKRRTLESSDSDWNGSSDKEVVEDERESRSRPKRSPITPRSKARLRDFSDRLKDHENRFEFSSAIECAEAALSINPNDKRLERRLLDLRNQEQTIRACRPKANPAKAFEAPPLEPENLRNVFLTPPNQLLDAHSLGKTCSEATRERAISELLHLFNTGTKDQLTQIQGIGKKRAQQIAVKRISDGPFSTLKDVAKLFGKKAIETFIRLKMCDVMLS